MHGFRGTGLAPPFINNFIIFEMGRYVGLGVTGAGVRGIMVRWCVDLHPGAKVHWGMERCVRLVRSFIGHLGVFRFDREYFLKCKSFCSGFNTANFE